ncbi:MAG: hypothetical protein Q8Q09_05520 [Deltaproteobacteria bacterium]|nr:hypothetical protein [Deltaproteobacteria bacterium]
MQIERSLGVVGVELGETVVNVRVVTEADARTRIEFTEDGPIVVLSDSLDVARANRAIAAIMPALVSYLSRRVLN